MNIIPQALNILVDEALDVEIGVEIQHTVKTLQNASAPSTSTCVGGKYSRTFLQTGGRLEVGWSLFCEFCWL
jgi:hypothetical protein